MARKYSRDNRGRFASSGSGGATARGGRLRAADGGKRTTQTASMKGSGPKAGTIAKGGRGGTKKTAPVAAPAKRQKPPPPPWSKGMLQAEKAVKAQAGAVKSVKAKSANAIKPSPRRLNSAEKAYAEIKAQKSKFGSDKKVREEMIRRGFVKGSDPQGQMIKIARTIRLKQGNRY